MLHQLLLQDPMLITQAIVEKFQTNNQLFYSESELSNVFLESAMRNHSQEILFVIDALDECLEQDRDTFIKFLTEF